MIRPAVIALALVAVVAGCGGDPEPAPPTVVVAPENGPGAPAPPEDAAEAGPSEDAAEADPGEEVTDSDAGSGAGDGDATTPAAPPLLGEDGPTPDDLDRYAAEQRETVERIREAVAEARDNPEALLELREELQPSRAERRRFERLLEQFCARPEASAPICDEGP